MHAATTKVRAAMRRRRKPDGGRGSASGAVRRAQERTGPRAYRASGVGQALGVDNSLRVVTGAVYGPRLSVASGGSHRCLPCHRRG